MNSNQSAKKIRVAHIIVKGDLAGGPGYSLLAFIKYLDSNTYESFVLAHSKGDLIETLKKYVLKVKFLKQAVIIKYNPFPFMLCVLQAFLFFKLNRIQIAHFQFHIYRDPVLVAARLARVKSIIHFRSPASGIKEAWFNLADAFIFNSHFCKQATPLNQTLEQKSYVIHNAIDFKDIPEIRTKEKAPICSEIGISSAKPIIGCVSRVFPAKKIEYFIEMAHKLSASFNCNFLIVGTLKDHVYLENLKRLLKDYQLEDKVKFLGHRKNIYAIYKILDVLVHTAFEEPFGRIFLEAGAIRVPVVAFRSGGVSEIIEDGKSGVLVEYGDVNGLAFAVERILTDPELAKRLSDEAYNRVVSCFSAEEHVKAIEKVYQNILLSR